MRPYHHFLRGDTGRGMDGGMDTDSPCILQDFVLSGSLRAAAHKKESNNKDSDQTDKISSESPIIY